MSNDDVFGDIRNELENKNQKEAERRKQDALHEKWRRSASRKATKALEPARQAVDTFLSALEKDLGLAVTRVPCERELHLTLAADEKRRVESYSFVCRTKAVPEYVNRRDSELTITLFAVYTPGEKGAIENVELQAAVDNPNHRRPTYSTTSKDSYYGETTDYYSHAAAIRNPSGEQLTEDVIGWLKECAANDKELQGKILKAPKIPAIKLPANGNQKPAEGNSIQVHTGHSFYCPSYD